MLYECSKFESLHIIKAHHRGVDLALFVTDILSQYAQQSFPLFKIHKIGIILFMCTAFQFLCTQSSWDSEEVL